MPPPQVLSSRNIGLLSLRFKGAQETDRMREPAWRPEQRAPSDLGAESEAQRTVGAVGALISLLEGQQ